MPQIKYIRTCSICRALDVIGDKPTLLLVESYWLGTRRFSAFQKQTGLLKTVVSDRLKRLIDAGCLKKTLYSESPKRYEYRGTDKFYDLYPVALSMLHWEQVWGAKNGKIRVSLVHKACGKTTNPHTVCEDCRSVVDPRDVDWREGPGVGLMPANYHRRRRETRKPQESSTPLFDEIVRIIGDRWSALIIRSIFTNLNSYQDICDDTGMATNILAERLQILAKKGIIKKNRSVYKLTPKGLAIYPILLALMEWGDKYYATEEGPPLYLTHKTCDNTLKGQIACSECGEGITMQDIEFEFLEEDIRSEEVISENQR